VHYSAQQRTISALLVANKSLIFIKFGRTDLRKGVPGAKFDAESDSEVRLAVAPPKPDENCKKLKCCSKKKHLCFFARRRKMKRRGLSETRFGKV